MTDSEPFVRRDGGYLDDPKPRRDWLLLAALACFIGAFIAVVILVVTA